MVFSINFITWLKYTLNWSISSSCIQNLFIFFSAFVQCFLTYTVLIRQKDNLAIQKKVYNQTWPDKWGRTVYTISALREYWLKTPIVFSLTFFWLNLYKQQHFILKAIFKPLVNYSFNEKCTLQFKKHSF